MPTTALIATTIQTLLFDALMIRLYPKGDEHGYRVLQPRFVEALILAIIFAPFFYAIKRRYDLRELNAKRDLKLLPEVSEVSRELEALREERRLLQERIENLESIVCNVDYGRNPQPSSAPRWPIDLPWALVYIISIMRRNCQIKG